MCPDPITKCIFLSHLHRMFNFPCQLKRWKKTIERITVKIRSIYTLTHIDIRKYKWVNEIIWWICIPKTTKTVRSCHYVLWKTLIFIFEKDLETAEMRFWPPKCSWRRPIILGPYMILHNFLPITNFWNFPPPIFQFHF